MRPRWPIVIILLATAPCALAEARGGELIVDLGTAQPVAMVGAILRWDADGKARFPVDPKARIDNPGVDAKAVNQGEGRWAFRELPMGTYDLVIVTSGRVRVEGFRYPPIAEFDPFLPADSPPPDEETREWILKHIGKSPHYENKVTPLYLAGGEKQVRILVQLVRDKPTSFDGDFGGPVATVRHEVWQYTNNYGGWVKDRRTEVLDRILMARSEFHRWTWIWEPRLGGVEVTGPARTLAYPLPERFETGTHRGWFPE